MEIPLRRRSSTGSSTVRSSSSSSFRDAGDQHTAPPQPAQPTLKLKLRKEGTGVKAFKLFFTTPFSKIMGHDYCKKDGHRARLFFDGDELLPDQTPQDLEMEEEDIIDMNFVKL